MFQFGPRCNENSDLVFHNGFCYVKSSTSRNTVYFECHERRSKQCFARASSSEGGPLVLTAEHNHYGNMDDELIYRFKKELYATVISSNDKLRTIFNNISVRHQAASTCVPFIKISKTMLNWRKLVCPSIPNSLEEYNILLNSERWKHLYYSDNSHLTVTNVYGEDGSIATVFLDPVVLRTFQSAHIYADATFKVCPRKPRKIYQLFTIMLSVDDSTVLPVSWSFMSRKSKSCYLAVIRYFARCAPNLQVLSFMMDYEVGLRNAFKECFPNAISRGCYFHYTQALIKKADKLGLLRLLRYWEDGKIFFRKIIALALLPANDIENAFEWLVNRPDTKTQFILIYSNLFPIHI